MVIDYSKWNHIGDSDDDDDDDKNESDDFAIFPQVTSLEQPGRVTIGPDGSTIKYMDEDDDDNTNNIPLLDSFHPQKNQKDTHHGASGRHCNPDEQKIKLLDSCNDFSHHNSEQKRYNTTNERTTRKRSLLTKNGGMHYHTILHNQSVSNNCNTSIVEQNLISIPIYWSQDRYVVTIRVGIDPTIFIPRNIRVQCKGALSYADRHSAVGSGMSESGDHGSIEIECIIHGKSNNRYEGGDNDSSIKANDIAINKVTLLYEKLHRPVHLNEGEDEIDYEIQDCRLEDIQLFCATADDTQQPATAMTITKFVTITLPKAVPMFGMTCWWDRLFVGYPTIDLDTIVRSERKNKDENEGGNDNKNNDDPQNKHGGGGINAEEAFRKAWEGAHATFREKIKSREKQSIDIDG